MGLEFVLNETLEKIDQTRNALAVEAKVRPATVNDIAAGRSKAITLAVLDDLLDALDRLDPEGRRHDVTDIVKRK